MERGKIYWKSIIKAGNTVKVRQWDDMKKEYGISYERGHCFYDACKVIINCSKKFTEDMKEYCGKTIKINKNMEKKFNECGFFYYEGYMFSTDMLEPYVVYEEELDVINIPVKDEYKKIDKEIDKLRNDREKNPKEKLKKFSEIINKMTSEELVDMLEKYGINEEFEYKEEPKEKTYLEKEWGIKDNILYGIIYKSEQTGERKFFGEIINFNPYQVFIIDDKMGLAVLSIKNIISMIPIKEREKN